MVHGPVREVVRGPIPLDWSMDWGSVFSGHPFLGGIYFWTDIAANCTAHALYFYFLSMLPY